MYIPGVVSRHRRNEPRSTEQDDEEQRRNAVRIHGIKDTLSEGSLYPGRALLAVAVLTFVALALRAF